MSIRPELRKDDLGSLIELYTLDLTKLAGTPLVYRFSPSQPEQGQQIVFGGQTYIPFPLKMGSWTKTIGGSPPRASLTVSNVTKYLQSDLTTYKDFIGATVHQSYTFQKYLDAASFLRRNRLDWSSKYNEGATWIKTQCTADEMSYRGPSDTTAWKVTDTSTSSASLLQHTNRNYGWAAGARFVASGYFCVCPDTTTPAFHMNVVSPGRESHAYFEIDTSGPTPTIKGSTSDPTFVDNVRADLVEVDGNRYWFRCSFSSTMVTPGNVQWRVWTNHRASHPLLGSLVVAGAQFEAGTLPTTYQGTNGTTHHTTADSLQVFNSVTSRILRKVRQNRQEIEFELGTLLDFQQQIPARQILRSEFPGAGLVRRG